MIRVGIVGGAGYTAGELLRLLIHHPDTRIAFVQSNSQAGLAVSDIHSDLAGDLNIRFDQDISTEVDVIFICSGHGKSRSFLENNTLPDRIKIIDLSNDFRLLENSEGFVYGLPELNRETIIASNKIANPGCFATAIQLALLPLAKQHLLKSEVHVHAITGSTGAGQQPGPKTHFSWRNNNVSIYKPFTHQHLGEICQSIRQCQPIFESEINFLPLRGNFTRGIFASLYMSCPLEIEAIQRLYATFYETHPFVHILSNNPALKQVVNTNKCYLFLEKHEGKLLVISTIDNLIKGASGQAIQNMNLMFGLTETTGLQLKGSAF